MAGGHDKSRMKQAMLNRKADINAGETVVASSFGTNHRGPPGGDKLNFNKDKKAQSAQLITQDSSKT